MIAETSEWREWLESLLEGCDLERALQAEQNGLHPVAFVLSERLAEPQRVLVALSSWYHCPHVDLKGFHPEAEALALVPHEVARRFLALPLFRLQDVLYVAMVDPMDLLAQDYLHRLAGISIQPVVVLQEDLESALRHHYLRREQTREVIGAITSSSADSQAIPVAPAIREDEEAPVIRLVQYFISNAIHLGASDLHLEPYASDIVLRYRVDGILHEFEPPPTHLYRSVVSRIKILSNLDISERRLPQDGRFTFPLNGVDYDMRVSIMPGVHGEHVVVRVLDTGATRQKLEDLGFSASTLSRFEQMITRPYGMVLVTGPTGSGKSTTLYTTLKHIYTPRRKIVTIEDPVECHLRGISQFQVSPETGFTFARGLRSILRHDPDVIMLGEIRDLESAEIALRSSLTGHLLFSTLHTNDAPLALTRLVEMGVPAFLVLSSLVGVLAQRLVRRLCLECRVPVEPTVEQWKAIGVDTPPAAAVIYGPKGCGACNHLGYRGRVGIHELLEVNSEVRALGLDGDLSARLRHSPMWERHVTLRKSAVEKLLEGITSMEEVLGMVTADD